MDIKNLIAAAADAAVAHEPSADIMALVSHAKDARLYVWDFHYGNTADRERLSAKLAESSPEFQRAVAVTEKALAEELADSSARRARIRAENPTLFKD